MGGRRGVRAHRRLGWARHALVRLAVPGDGAPCARLHRVEPRGLHAGLVPYYFCPARRPPACRGLGKTLWTDALVNMLWHAEQMLAAGDPAMDTPVALPAKV